MFRSVNGVALALFLVLAMLPGGLALAQQAAVASLKESPAEQSSVYDLIDEATAQVMDVLATAEEYVDDDPERYYQRIETILDPLIDYRGFARQVMGPYASSKRYRSLDEDARRELRAQLDRFTEVMHTSLIRTYGKGLLAFGDSRIELDLPENKEVTTSRVSVRQLIYADRVTPYIVLYQMGRSKTGEWMLRNVIIESVNLGEIYRDQFLASARELEGDLDAVIDNWTTVTVDVESK